MANNNPYGLTDKQVLFSERYLTHFNGAEAAREAGYSKKTAKVIASENLTKPNIQQYLKDLYQKKQKEFNLSPDRILSELDNILSQKVTDILDFDDEGIHLKDSSQLSDGAVSAIHEVSSVPGGVKVKMYSKMDAIDKAMKYHGMYIQRVKNEIGLDEFDVNKLDANERDVFIKLLKKGMTKDIDD